MTAPANTPDFTISFHAGLYTITPNNTRALCWLIAHTTTTQRPQHTIAQLAPDALTVFLSDAVLERRTYAPAPGTQTDWLQLAASIMLPEIDRITLTPGQPVTATYSGPHRTTIIALFDTDTIPAPYDSRVPRQDILEAVQRLNPRALVEWAVTEPTHDPDTHKEMKRLLLCPKD